MSRISAFALAFVSCVLVSCLVTSVSKGADNNAPTIAIGGKPPASMPATVTKAEEDYRKALLAASEDTALSVEQRNQALVKLARLGYIPAFEKIASSVKDELGRQLLVWESAVSWDTSRTLLFDKNPNVRMMGLLLAYLRNNRTLLNDGYKKEENPEVRRRYWYVFGMARDFDMLPEIAAVAARTDAPAADREAAETALGAYLGTEKLSLEQFKNRLEEIRGMVSGAKQPTTQKLTTEPANP